MLASSVFEPFVGDCTKLVRSEVKRRGITLRTAFGVVEKIKPNILERTVREQMPDLLHELEPLYSEHRANNADATGFGAHLNAHDVQVADAILHVADQRAESVQNGTIRSAYGRVRGRAKREIVSAVPPLASIIERHLKSSA
ncbi:hypothetical protein SADO_16168 [Salinisphaera dokdonensis CL-ES53]|uniref:Uncharacterized protein n=1 Tax=Salinisphaera dokdonensis CL-ES53 TaxID=1304272 RepID=A0ABV2B555_9GAMM